MSWTELLPGAMLMSESNAELTPPLTGYSTQDSWHHPVLGFVEELALRV